MRVRIKEWNAVASWRWDMPEDEVCGICRVQFDGTCPTCKFPGDDCSLLIGKCGHSFHMHCLLTWIAQESSKGLCPMCRQSMAYTTELGMYTADIFLLEFEWKKNDDESQDTHQPTEPAS
ncbi:Zinc finger, RING-type [Penicillium occitanis (nom. inval.)]|nr:hypothetical protein PENOC_074560 [Penicillium occitanis (nom. inval.)]PCG97082.1 Zinc finger, RING-type [Penicillium occitanis (nom. inval.)]